jgi:dTDP-4-amino-4,6-dideoxy-D-glucose transaminase
MLEIVRPRFPEIESFDARFGTALRRGQVTNGGEHVRQFEQELADYLGVLALAFVNGQTALIAMLMAAGIKPGDEVIVPAFTFCGTAAAVAMLGAVPVFAEIDPKTLTLDPGDADARVTDRTAAILGVDVYGICCDYKALTELTFKHDVWLLFDSAPAFGSMVDGQPVGRYGDAQIFSFHATKPFSTMEGGCLASPSPDFIERAGYIREFGQDGQREVVSVGLNGKMTEAQALVGLERFRQWTAFGYHQQRQYKIGVYRYLLSEIPGVRVINPPDDQWPIWLYMPILVYNRDVVLKRLHERGVMARKYYAPCLHQTPAFQRYARGPLPISEEIGRQIIALPCYSDITDGEMHTIVKAVQEAME